MYFDFGETERANSLARVQDSKAIGDARSAVRSRRGGVAGGDRVCCLRAKIKNTAVGCILILVRLPAPSFLQQWWL
jgi:hypothetical protein